MRRDINWKKEEERKWLLKNFTKEELVEKYLEDINWAREIIQMMKE